MPPARTENSLAPTRGLTQTIRWARRARRSISRPTTARVAALPAVGEDHDHGPTRHAATPVAVVELLQRVADPGPARPVRRRRGSALDRPLGMARRQRAGEAGQPGGEDERLGVGAAARGAGQELQVGAGVGLHRARDVAQHHEPARDDAPAPARQADRVAAGAQAGPQGPPHVDALAAAAALVAAGAPRRGRELEARHQPVELRELVRLERVEALACAAPPRRWPSPAGRRSPCPLIAPRRPGEATTPPSPSGPRRQTLRASSRRSACGRSSGGAATVSSVVGLGALGSAEPPKTERKTASKASACARSETNTDRAVQ